MWADFYEPRFEFFVLRGERICFILPEHTFIFNMKRISKFDKNGLSLLQTTFGHLY
jgi:hypothetical protein